MNKTKRDYCSKGKHPRWKAWRAEYDMSTTAWTWRGNFCLYCGAKIMDVFGYGPPKARVLP